LGVKILSENVFSLAEKVFLSLGEEDSGAWGRRGVKNFDLQFFLVIIFFS
jgi:hypothetical protein